MQVIDNTETKYADRADYNDITGRLEDIFSGAWRDAKHDIAHQIRLLRKNGSLLREFFRSITVLAKDGGWPRLMGAQSFYIYEGINYYMRVNLWFPKNNRLKYRQRELSNYLSIEVPHNHSFSFFTTTLAGPGYSTLFFQIGELNQNLMEGDVISIHGRREIVLSGDTVLYVNKDEDFHVQRWPDEMSITLNVVPRDRTAFSERQYIVDMHTSTVARVLDSSPDIPSEE